MRPLLLSGFLFCISLPAYSAGITEKACLQSDRSPGPEVCSCAQVVADQMLTASDQRDAAKIIAEPDIYLEFKYGTEAKKTFLDRYRAWGDASAQFCTQ